MSGEVSESDIRELLRRIEAGDRSALDRLFEQYRAYLKRLVSLRMSPDLKPRIDPSDVVQEAQVEMAGRIHDYLRDRGVSFRIWIRQLALDKVRQAYRRHVEADRRSVKHELHLPQDSSVQLSHQLADSDPGPESRFDKREVVRRLRRAIDELSETDQEIILLHNFEGLTSNESAEVLGVTPAAARKRYGRALRRLRELLVRNDL